MSDATNEGLSSARLGSSGAGPARASDGVPLAVVAAWESGTQPIPDDEEFEALVYDTIGRAFRRGA